MYGVLQIANRYVTSWIWSFKANQDKDDRVKLFCRFIGLNDDALPYSIYNHYVSFLK
jgi:hypothetical protein